MTHEEQPAADGPDDLRRREIEDAFEVLDDVVPPDEGPARGMRALTAEQFSLTETIGGVRGLVESMAPGLVFVVVFIATGSSLTPALIASVAVALVAVAARLIQRTPITQAFGGLLGVGIGVVWAWKSGEAQNYYAMGLITNGLYLVAMLVSILVRWPVVGLVVEALRSGWGSQRPAQAASGTATAAEGETPSATPQPGGLAQWAGWRRDPALMKRYAIATWLWVAMFGLRLAVQLPLFYSAEVGWLGTARLIMGIPLWALTLWLTWVLVRQPGAAPSRATARTTQPPTPA